jgi:hypothetical protein
MNRRIVAVDPGPEQSAWIRLEGDRPVGFAKHPNHDVLPVLGSFARTDELAIEAVQSYGKNVGASVFDTCTWTGRFMQRWLDAGGPTLHRIFRPEVKRHLAGRVNARDSDVRVAILRRYADKYDTLEMLDGITGDVWQALAVALTYRDLFQQATDPKGTRW